MSSSESDLSDIPEQQPPAAAPFHDSVSPLPQENGFHAEESDLSEDQDTVMGSDDADFEVESQPPEPSAPEVPSSSEDSTRPLKRKAHGGIEDDEDIMNNPELYGIRRSVGSFLAVTFLLLLAKSILDKSPPSDKPCMRMSLKQLTLSHKCP